jgi:hypothetical protein
MSLLYLLAHVLVVPKEAVDEDLYACLDFCPLDCQETFTFEGLTYLKLGKPVLVILSATYGSFCCIY